MLIVTSLCVALGTLLPSPVFAQDEWADSTDEGGYSAGAGEMKTVAVVAITNYGELVGDVGFCGSLADRPELGQMLEGMVAMFTGGKGLIAIDKTKPWGVILQTDGMQFLPIGCLPVTDFDGLMALVQGFGVPITDGDDGVKQISTPDGKTLFVKHDGDWAYVAQSADSLAQVPANPEASLAQLVADHDLGVQLFVQNVPDMYRQMAISAMKSGMEDGLQRQEGEDDDTFEARRQMAEAQVEQIERMINEIDDVGFGWAIDADEQRTYLDMTYTFLPGSKMAQQIAGYGQPRTNFAGFFQPDAAFTMSFATQSDPELMREDVEQFKAMLQTMRKQAEKAIDEDADIPDDDAREAFKSALGEFLDAAQATIEAGKIDGGAALQLQPGALTFVGGGLVKEPAKIESGLKKIAAVAENKPDFPGIQWNAASHAGVNFHTLSAPIPADEEDAREMFGDKVDIAIGIGSEAVYFAVGSDHLAAISQAIDASAAEPNKDVPPFEMSASLGQIMAMAATKADESDRQMVEAIADMLNNQAQGRDHIRIIGKLIENGLRYRIEAEEGVLRAIGKAAAEAQRQQQAQMQGLQ
jgi:hypothetical protein